MHIDLFNKSKLRKPQLQVTGTVEKLKGCMESFVRGMALVIEVCKKAILEGTEKEMDSLGADQFAYVFHIFTNGTAKEETAFHKVYNHWRRAISKCRRGRWRCWRRGCRVTSSQMPTQHTPRFLGSRTATQVHLGRSCCAPTP